MDVMQLDRDAWVSAGWRFHALGRTSTMSIDEILAMKTSAVVAPW
jgi:hypothetical protein